ncbi:MAG: hypothetical protein FWF29_08325, partial [Treponema sp.]|nr:hypothetical protein [Treponema sp.]
GDYFRSLEKATKNNNPKGKKKTQIRTDSDLGKNSKMQKVNNLGFTQDEAEKLQQLTPESVEAAKAEAEAKNDIPTRSLALKLASKKRKEKQLKNAKKSILEQTKNAVKVTSPTVYLIKFIYNIDF